MKTITDFRRAATTGSRWQCVNQLHPHVSGVRVVTGGKAVLGYVAVKADGTVHLGGRLEIPKAAAVRVDGDTVTFLYGPDDSRVAYTWTRLPDVTVGSDMRPGDVVLFNGRARTMGPIDDHGVAAFTDGTYIPPGERFTLIKRRVDPVADVRADGHRLVAELASIRTERGAGGGDPSGLHQLIDDQTGADLARLVDSIRRDVTREGTWLAEERAALADPRVSGWAALIATSRAAETVD